MSSLSKHELIKTKNHMIVLHDSGSSTKLSLRQLTQRIEYAYTSFRLCTHNKVVSSIYGNSVYQSIAAGMDEPVLPQHSSIPQFLLDTQHPWIVKHQSLLERLPDVESFLHSPPGTKYRASISQLQQHDTSARPTPTDDKPDLGLNLEVPADLFNSLNINNNRSHTPRAGWPNARDRLLELQRCPAAALARVRSLDVRVWVHRGVFASSKDLQAEEWQDLGGPAGDELLDLFASVLAAMTGLERLRWEMLPDFARRMREGLVGGRGLRLPTVSRLEVAPFCEYMVDACPNVEVLGGERLMAVTGEKGEDRYAEMLVEEAAKLPKVKEFSGMAAAGLTPSFLSAMVKSMPRLVRIKLSGRIPRPPPVRDPDTGERRPGQGGVTLKDVLAVLAEFPDLEELGLPAAMDLRHGILGPFSCGTASLMGAEAAEHNYRMHRDEHLQVEEVASVIVETLPRLKRLSIDGREATITHDEDGKASASWPWSGRLDEYLDEILLRRPKA